MDFRIIATINAADRHFLFRMSDALKRRFAFIELPSTEDFAREWSIVSKDDAVLGSIDPLDADVYVEVRRFVYLARTLHPIGTAQLLAAVRFVRASRGAPMTAEHRTFQALAGSVLPTLEESDPNLLRAVAAWSLNADWMPALLEAERANPRRARLDGVRRSLVAAGFLPATDANPPAEPLVVALRRKSSVALVELSRRLEELARAVD